MAFKGRPKPPGSGRKPGSKNKDSIPLQEMVKRTGIDPFEVLLLVAKEDWKALGYPQRTEVKFSPQGIEFEEYIIPLAMRVKAASELCQYLHAKRRAVEHGVDAELLELVRQYKDKPDKDLIEIVDKERLDYLPALPSKPNIEAT